MHRVQLKQIAKKHCSVYSAVRKQKRIWQSSFAFTYAANYMTALFSVSVQILSIFACFKQEKPSKTVGTNCVAPSASPALLKWPPKVEFPLGHTSFASRCLYGSSRRHKLEHLWALMWHRGTPIEWGCSYWDRTLTKFAWWKWVSVYLSSHELPSGSPTHNWRRRT